MDEQIKWESKVSADCNWPYEGTILHDKHVVVALQAIELASLRTKLDAAEKELRAIAEASNTSWLSDRARSALATLQESSTEPTGKNLGEK